MIITVQGYNKKANHAEQVTAILAGMTAYQTGMKTLVLQLVNNRSNTVESMLTGIQETEKLIGSGKSLFAEEGMDALLRAADSGKLLKEDFDQYCTAMMKIENALDVCGISKASSLEETLLNENKMENVRSLIESAKSVYDIIYILAPTNNEILSEKINAMADKAVYCIYQGESQKKPMHGKINYCIVSNFDSDSQFSIKYMQKTLGKGRWGNIPYCTGCSDAARSGNLLRFIRQNRNDGREDANYRFSENVKSIVASLTEELSEEGTGKMSFAEFFASLFRRKKEKVKAELEQERLAELSRERLEAEKQPEIPETEVEPEMEEIDPEEIEMVEDLHTEEEMQMAEEPEEPETFDNNLRDLEETEEVEDSTVPVKVKVIKNQKPKQTKKPKKEKSSKKRKT